MEFAIFRHNESDKNMKIHRAINVSQECKETNCATRQLDIYRYQYFSRDRTKYKQLI